MKKLSIGFGLLLLFCLAAPQVGVAQKLETLTSKERVKSQVLEPSHVEVLTILQNVAPRVGMTLDELIRWIGEHQMWDEVFEEINAREGNGCKDCIEEGILQVLDEITT